MNSLDFYIVDVFTNAKYGGNQLAVFIDLDNFLSNDDMLQIAREINFAETTFVKKHFEDGTYDVRIFTTEYEVPFAGHPSLGTAYIIVNHLCELAPEKVVLKLKHANIEVRLEDKNNPRQSLYEMTQSQPEFIKQIDLQQLMSAIGLDQYQLETDLPFHVISTGLFDLARQASVYYRKTNIG